MAITKWNFKLFGTIKLNFDDGNKGKFKFLDLIKLTEGDYVVLLPDGGNGEQVTIFKVEKNKNSMRYLPVTSGETLNKVLDIYNNGKNNILKKKQKRIVQYAIAVPIISFLVIYFMFIHQYELREVSEVHTAEAHARMLVPEWHYMTDNSTDVTFEYRQYMDYCIDIRITGFDRLRCDPKEVLSWHKVKH